MAQPLLSIFIPARNDSFMGNFHYRITTMLNFLAESLKEVNRLNDVEVLVTDWGSKEPLYKVLTLSNDANKIVKYILVPPEVAVREERSSEFPIVLAQNTAIRRAKGQYIMQTDSDVLYPVEFVKKLFNILESEQVQRHETKKTFFGAKRRHIPREIFKDCVPTQVLRDYIASKGPSLPLDINWEWGYCATGMMMMHRDLWFECSGYDERLIHWGWMEIDLGIRITQRYPWFDLTCLDMVLYHLEHYRERVVERKMNTMRKENIFRPNGVNWGLAHYDLEIISPMNHKREHCGSTKASFIEQSHNFAGELML